MIETTEKSVNYVDIVLHNLETGRIATITTLSNSQMSQAVEAVCQHWQCQSQRYLLLLDDENIDVENIDVEVLEMRVCQLTSTDQTVTIIIGPRRLMAAAAA